MRAESNGVPRAGTGRGGAGASWRVGHSIFGTGAALLLGLVGIGGCSREPVEPGAPLGAFVEHLDHRIPHLMARYEVPGVAVAVVRGGEPAWSAAYGYADEQAGRPMTVDAVFRAESISKAVTAWGVMRLVEQGRIGLDDPVQTYLGQWKLPESGYAEEAVTIRRLLSSSAGMPLGTVGPAVQYAPGSDMPALPDYLAHEARLEREPGSAYSYSNVGFNLLELVIDKVTGRDFAQYMADEVLMPLGMRSSSFAWNPTVERRIATGYDLHGQAVPTYVYPARASGGLFTTVDDIARFVSAGMSAADHSGVLGREGIRTLQSPQVAVSGIFALVADAYGFGHFLDDRPGSSRAVWVGGQGNGWMTDFHAVPESGDAIVILTNSQRSWPLMSHILIEWAHWSGTGPVKWARIAYGVTVLWVIAGMVVLAALWQAWRLARGLRRGERRWAPLSRERMVRRLLQAGSATGVIALLAWSAAQPYLMVSSVFPGVASWAGVAFLLLAAVALGSALCPPYSGPTARSGPLADGAGRRRGLANLWRGVGAASPGPGAR
jgi:CubicO group peptidase (beta-lactamase class C family)